jgi:hypothetical protein
MEMEPNLVLNQTNFKFFVKMTRTKGFRNPKNHKLVSRLRSSKENKKKQKLGLGPKDSF